MSSPTPGTQQPYEDQQQAESVDLTPVETAFAAALAALLLAWLAIKSAWVLSLTEQITAQLLARGLPGLTRLDLDTSDGTKVVHDALVQYARTAAHHVVTEAREQGVTIQAAELDDDELGRQAEVASRLLADALTNSAAAEAVRVHPPESVVAEEAKKAAQEAERTGRPAKEAADAAREAIADGTSKKVREHLDSLTDAQVRYVLGSFLTGAQNQARIATFLGAAGAEDAELRASEVLDTNTCAPCRAVHGVLLARLSVGDFRLLRALYPVRGYLYCLGRDRCRGTVVGIWIKNDEEAT